MRTRLEIIAVVLAMLAVGWLSWRLEAAERATDAAARTRDSLLIEEAAERARADGWETRFGEETERLDNLLGERDRIADALRESLRQANARILSLTDVVATLKDSLRSVATAVDTTEAGVVSYAGGIADGLLTGTWRFLPPELALAYSVSVPLEIVTSEGGDGRWLVTARATDPRASVEVSGFWFDPPPPVQVQRCTVGQTLRRVGIGILAGYGLAR